MPNPTRDDSTQSPPSEQTAGKGNAQEAAGAPLRSSEAADGRLQPRRAGGRRPAGSVAQRVERYLVAPGQPAMRPAIDMRDVARRLRETQGVELIEVLAPPDWEARPADSIAASADPDPVIVARMSSEQARLLRQQAGGRLVVEPDLMLTLSSPDSGWAGMEIHDPGVAIPHAAGFSASFTVTGDGKPLEGAVVHLFGRIWSAQGVTGADGQVRLMLYGEDAASLTALQVRPRADYWSYWMRDPAIMPDRNHPIALIPLAQTMPGFPARPIIGWGQRAMGLDQLPAGWRGQNIKIAIIDSGVATTHRNLGRVHMGLDAVDRTRDGWNQDAIGHGTHCAGIIAGSDVGSGIRGFAPDAELHVCRLFSGGRFSGLIRALDYCLEKQVDIVNLSCGSREASEIVERRIALAKQRGIACIAAAGNSAGRVEYPAASTQVLAVAAMGRAGEYPAESYHAVQSLDGCEGADTGGLFAARFSCHGPEIDLVAPGVAIVSSVPADGFAAYDGTSAAAAHVTGLAALLLAHLPDFAGIRGAARVERLFQILKLTANPLALDDAGYSGAGLPDAVRAFSLEANSAPGIAAARVKRLVGDTAGVDLDGLKAAMSRAGLVDRPPNGCAEWAQPGGGAVLRGPAAVALGPLVRVPIGAVAAPATPPGTGITVESLRRAMEEAAVL